jgi:hypothetical protein
MRKRATPISRWIGMIYIYFAGGRSVPPTNIFGLFYYNIYARYVLIPAPVYRLIFRRQ